MWTTWDLLNTIQHMGFDRKEEAEQLDISLDDFFGGPNNRIPLMKNEVLPDDLVDDILLHYISRLELDENLTDKQALILFKLKYDEYHFTAQGIKETILSILKED